MRFILFSKHLEHLSYEELADTIAGIGLDGVDLTVRSPGHVLPENVKTDLPKAAKAIRDRGLEVGWITTNIYSADAPHAEDILATASDLGISQFKLGYHKYDGFGNIKRQLAEVREAMQGIERLCHKYDVCGGMHVHSGPNLAAVAPIIGLQIEGFDPQAIGLYADLGHMGIEGSFGGWIQGLDLLSDRLIMLALKNMGQFWKRMPRPASSSGTGGWCRSNAASRRILRRSATSSRSATTVTLHSTANTKARPRGRA